MKRIIKHDPSGAEGKAYAKGDRAARRENKERGMREKARSAVKASDPAPFIKGVHSLEYKPAAQRAEAIIAAKKARRKIEKEKKKTRKRDRARDLCTKLRLPQREDWGKSLNERSSSSEESREQ